MNRLSSFIIFLAAMLLCSCGGNEFAARLDALDSVIVAHPDSVYHELDALQEEAEGQSRALRMRYELLRADAQNKAYIDFTTDSVMKLVADYYESHGTPNEKLRAYYLLGCTYRDLNDVPMELQCFQDAVERADTTSSDCDLYTLCAVYGQMADLYHYQYLPQEELDAAEKSERAALLDKDSLSAIRARGLCIRAYHLLGMEDKVIETTEYVRERYLELSDTLNATLVVCAPIQSFLEKGRYDEAKKYIETYLNNPKIFKDGHFLQDRFASVYYSLGEYYLHECKLDSARYCFSSLLSYDHKEAAYKGLLELSKLEHNADSMEKYAVLFAATNDSSYLGTNHERIAQMTAMYDYSEQKKKADAASQLVIKSGRTILTLSVSILLLIIAIGTLYIWNYFKRKATSAKINSLNADIEHYSLHLAELQNTTDERINTLKLLLEESRNELAKYKNSQTFSAFFDSDIYKVFNKAGRNGLYKVSTKEWGKLQLVFNNTFNVYSDFIHSNHSMTLPQIYVCMLIRIGFGESEMANIMDVDLKRISRIKSQINQKLFDSSGAKSLASNLKPYF